MTVCLTTTMEWSVDNTMDGAEYSGEEDTTNVIGGADNGKAEPADTQEAGSADDGEVQP